MFSPIVKHSSIRVLLAIVVFFDLELEQLDVKTTFLHGDLQKKKKNYMKQPEGFVVEAKVSFEEVAIWLKAISTTIV